MLAFAKDLRSNQQTLRPSGTRDLLLSNHSRTCLVPGPSTGSGELIKDTLTVFISTSSLGRTDSTNSRVALSLRQVKHVPLRKDFRRLTLSCGLQLGH